MSYREQDMILNCLKMAKMLGQMDLIVKSLCSNIKKIKIQEIYWNTDKDQMI